MDATPKILVVTNSYPNRYKCYAGMHIKRHVLLHRASGVHITVLTSHDSRRGLYRSTVKYIRLFLKVLQAMLFADFDLVHTHWILPAGLFGFVLSRVRRKPFVLTSHGSSIADFESKPWPVQTLVRKILRSADVVIAVGQEHRSKIEAIAGVSSERMRVIGMGVWLNQPVVSQLEARRILALPTGEKIIIYVGNLEKVKGPDVLIKAASALLEQGFEFRLIIGGQGPEKQHILNMIDDLRLTPAIDIIGDISPDDVFVWLSAADVCVVPSRRETFGLVAAEAMTCGTAVIASAVGGLSESITHGKNGLLFPVDDHAALAVCLREVLVNDDLREHVAEQGRRTAAAYDMRLQAAKVREIYLDLLAKN